MARKTIEKKLAAERAKYEAAMRTLGEGMQRAIVEMLAPLIPEGWYLVWEQKDDCYNDEDYYFDVEARALNSVLKPRKGRRLTEARPQRLEEREVQSWDGRIVKQQFVVDCGAPATYDWHLDEKCKPRKRVEFYSDDDPGVIFIGGDRVGDLLDESAYADLVATFEDLDKSDLRRAFGDSATVRVNRDGTYEVE